MINLNNKAEQQAAANSIQKKARRIVTMKSGNNQAMVQTVQKAVTHGIDALIITPRVDVAGNKYAWVGLRKGKTELQGKILLNSHIMELPAGGPARQGIARNLGVFRRERKLRPARMADRSGKRNPSAYPQIP